MINLVEKIITYRSGPQAGKQVDISKFDRSDRQAIEQFVNNDQIFDQNAVKYIKDLIVDSIMQYGIDTAQNHFLYFVSNPKISKVQIPFEYGKMIQKELQTHDLNDIYNVKSYASEWLYDPRTYKGDIYKLKALFFLSDWDEAEKYGPLNKRPFEEVLKANSKSEIETILSNWQTKDGSEQSFGRSGRRSSAKTGKSSTGSQSYFVGDRKDIMERKETILDLMSDSVSVSDKQLAKVINSVFKSDLSDNDIIAAVIKSLGQQGGVR